MKQKYSVHVFVRLKLVERLMKNGIQKTLHRSTTTAHTHKNWCKFSLQNVLLFHTKGVRHFNRSAKLKLLHFINHFSTFSFPFFHSITYPSTLCSTKCHWHIVDWTMYMSIWAMSNVHRIWNTKDIPNYRNKRNSKTAK